MTTKNPEKARSGRCIRTLITCSKTARTCVVDDGLSASATRNSPTGWSVVDNARYAQDVDIKRILTQSDTGLGALHEVQIFYKQCIDQEVDVKDLSLCDEGKVCDMTLRSVSEMDVQTTTQRTRLQWKDPL